ncbi:MAG: apolipoprotein N-acyltransferase [Ottowia sp.]
MIAALIALAAGALHALALADPWTGQAHGWLQGLSLVLLVALLMPAPHAGRPRWRRGLALAWLFALAWLAGTFWWLFISMHVYGGLSAALAVAAVLALAGLLALYYGVAGALFVHWARRERPATAALLFAALWTLAELARGRWFTGFPWGAGGYAHVDGVLAALARWVGVYGIGLAAAWLAALLALALGRRAVPHAQPARGLAVAGLLAALLLGWGLAQPWLPTPPTPAGPRLEVALLQGNIAQDEKFIPGTGVVDSLRWYGEQLQANTAPLVLAPETALPLLPRQLPEGYWAALQARYARPGQAALLGMPLGDLDTGYTNSAVGLAPGQAAPYRYDKHHLVPFGEFIPPLFRWFVQLMNIPLGDFTPGAINQPSFAWQGQRLAPNICYEDLFGEELAARFADPATAPTAFVNLSNIAWFGDTVAIDQHLAISRMRALEFERPVLRATNTGATAIVDAQGRITQQLPRLTRGVLRGAFQGGTGITPYAAWAARWGLAPLWGAAALIVLAAAATGRRGD